MKCKLCETEMKPIYGYDPYSPYSVVPVTINDKGNVSLDQVLDLEYCPNCGMVFVDISRIGSAE